MWRNPHTDRWRRGFGTARAVLTAALTVALGFLGLIAAREYHLAHGRREIVERWESRAKLAGEYLRGIAPSSTAGTGKQCPGNDEPRGPATDGLRRPAHPRVVVLLRRGKIQLLDGDRLLREWGVSLPYPPTSTGSSASQDHSRLEVPTGLFYVCSKTSFTPRFRFFALSYPSVTDADLALGQGRITATQAARIRRAIARREPPPTDTSLGGPLGIQGTGSPSAADPVEGVSLTMADADIAVLYRIIEVGDPVEIVAAEE